MQNGWRYLGGSLLVVWVTAFARNPIIAQTILPDIVVALDGSGDFTSIQEAILAVPDYSTVRTTIFIKRGRYQTEKLLVPRSKQKIHLLGESRDETVLSYHLYDCSAGGYANKCPETDARKWSAENLLTSATLTVLADDFTAENLSVYNTAGPVGQALALTLRGDRALFRYCNLSSYQDTLYLWSEAKRAYFEHCLISGRTDYIYGSGTAFFQSCEIKSWGGGWITAPSTAQFQPHGFVFHSCVLSYATNSPRPGDDGALVALGRPWHNYPKVAWLYCDMTAKINPLGWPDKWNMPYADTSTDLHLYEYRNTGPGADMSKRSKWVGLRAMSDEEATQYSVQAVLGGTDHWDPAAIAPATTTYQWTGKDTLPGWKQPQNWSPAGVPDSGQIALAAGPVLLQADGGHFAADLFLSSHATLQVTKPSTVTYLRLEKATLSNQHAVSLQGKIHTLDTVHFQTLDTFYLKASITGVHTLQKKGPGTLRIQQSNPDFNGFWILSEGVVQADHAQSLGKARRVRVDSGATLQLLSEEALSIETPLQLMTGSKLFLSANIPLKEWYLDTTIQPEGIYNAQTHPDWISGPGSIQIGRPSFFTFIGGTNGNWDNPLHFNPAFLPLAGEAVQNSREMETTPFIFPANIQLRNGGKIRLRGTHSCLGTIFMENGSSIGYATSGNGFSLDAPIQVAGSVELNMNSKAPVRHEMILKGSLSGSGTITLHNQRTDIANQAVVVLSGDNTAFSGTWSLSRAAGHPQSSIAIQANAANALGAGLLEISADNRAILRHPYSLGEKLHCNLYDNARIQLDTLVTVKEAIINGSLWPPGIYTAGNTPAYFVGTGSLHVESTTAVTEHLDEPAAYFAENILFFPEEVTVARIFNSAGAQVKIVRRTNRCPLYQLPSGVYVCQYSLRGQIKTIRVWVP